MLESVGSPFEKSIIFTVRAKNTWVDVGAHLCLVHPSRNPRDLKLELRSSRTEQKVDFWRIWGPSWSKSRSCWSPVSGMFDIYIEVVSLCKLFLKPLPERLRDH